MNKFALYLKNSYKELAEKDTWPNWNELQQSTMIVLISTIIITLAIGLIDFLTGGALNFLYNTLYS